ncbi:hypothetical protein V1478_014899 [Vespula squamosa]|uniref:Uncharacterized protein n=1 Tax=Vespula squamosa TaxID=30214 RepID=A0ABD2A3K4_VESSQ
MGGGGVVAAIVVGEGKGGGGGGGGGRRGGGGGNGGGGQRWWCILAFHVCFHLNGNRVHNKKRVVAKADCIVTKEKNKGKLKLLMVHTNVSTQINSEINTINRTENNSMIGNLLIRRNSSKRISSYMYKFNQKQII